MSVPKLEAYTRKFRELIEPAWSINTASYGESNQALDPNAPAAKGHCVITSAFLLSGLRRAFPENRFRMTVGCVLVDGALAINHHTYVTEHSILGRPPVVLDATPDQTPEITNTIVVANMQELAVNGLTYLAYNQYEEPPNSICEDREGDLHARMSLLVERLVAIYGNNPLEELRS